MTKTKPSGDPLLGDIPAHWTTKRAKEVLRTAAKRTRTAPTKYVGLEHVSSWTGKAAPVDLAMATAESAQPIRKGAVCFSKLRPYLAKAFIADQDLLGTSELIAMRCLPEMLPEYALSWMLTEQFIGAVNDTVSGAKMPRIDWPTLAEMTFPIPPLEEQRRIAAWIARQSERIDVQQSLLSERRRLLTELRQAVIDTAMTYGLDGKPVIQTGQTVLREMPSHWTLSKFKQEISFREGPGIMAVDFKEHGVPLLRIGNITPGMIDLRGCNFLAPEKVEKKWRHFRVKLGDLIISASASTGIVSEVGTDAVGSIPYTGLIMLRPKANLIQRFLKYFVVSRPFLLQIEDHLKGSTITHYGPTHLRQMFIAFPDRDEQLAIVTRLDRQCEQIDGQLTLIERLDELLAEERRAVVYAAVTGKTDVARVSKAAKAVAETA